MKVILIVYGVFASFKWLANYMYGVAMDRYVVSMGLDGPSWEEIDFYVREEVRRIFRREWWRESMEQTLFSRADLMERWSCSKRYIEELEKNGVITRVNLSKVLYPVSQIREIEMSEEPSPTLDMVRSLKMENSRLKKQNEYFKKSIAELSKALYEV